MAQQHTVETSATTARGHDVDTRPSWGRLAIFSIQHVLIMYTGCITVPLVFGAAAGLGSSDIALLISADLLVAGIITAIQGFGLGRIAGVRLPIVCGATFTGLTPMVLIAEKYGLQAVWGSMLIGGLVGIALAIPFSKIIRFFPTLVTGAVLTVVGLSLIGVAGGLIVGSDPKASDYAAPHRLILALVVVVIAVTLLVLGKGIWSRLAVLVALVVGTAIAAAMGMFHLDDVSNAGWVGFPTPFHFGAPQFPIAAIISMSIVMVVVFAESTASMLAISEITGKPLGPRDLTRGLIGDGLSGVLGGIFGGFPDTVFGQNVGAVATSRVHSRYVTATSGLILIVLALFPKMGAVIAALPGPVVGGVGLVLFATVALIGIRSLAQVDLGNPVNLTIAAVAVGAGLLPEFVPDMFERLPDSLQIIFGSGITLTAVVAFVLNLIFHHTPLKRRIEGHPDRDVTADRDTPNHITETTRDIDTVTTRELV
ncbi:nucleobase:cation symporter-2 family protein [Gordonia jinhuaensis]|uniref:Xanthine/uracil permease n=1 Tax=Gordonia jinhuaensis TaxID=1517702 RepID=A0A916TEM3_9ACTN|nr:nucleobase:cation symporter-2 family protein [Gordonia jinhuaensis]GGB42429.1 xanthine/uracil permease [Gordonia jinhuaensis]